MKTPSATYPYRTASLKFFKAYLITMRPYLLFVSGITGIAGMAFSPDVPLTQSLCIGIAAFLSYGFGQALTDCFQIDTDSISSPYRPLTRGWITPAQVLTVSLAGLSLCIGIIGFYNPLTLPLGLLAGLGLATYTPFKRRWWAGPFYNAWIVALLCVIGSLAAGVPATLLASGRYLLCLLTVFFGYANFVLAGYFKDIEADRQTGYRTLPVVRGRRVSSAVSDLFAAIAAGCALLLLSVPTGRIDLSPGRIPAFAFLAAGIAASVRGQFLLRRVKTDEGAHPAIALTVHSYVLLLSAIASSLKPLWSVLLAVFYLGFVIVLRIRPEKNQI